MIIGQTRISSPRPPPAKGTLREYCVQHWHGDLGLAQSYWVNLVALSAGLAVLVGAASAFGSKVDLDVMAIATMLAYAVVYWVVVWQFVGVCRSTRRYIRRGGSPFGEMCGWMGIALAIGGHAIVATALTIPHFNDAVAMLRGDPNVPRMEISVLPSGREVEITGGLPAGCAQDFRSFMSGVPDVQILHVNNTGGRIHEALDIARIVAERKMTTYVSVSCESAATLIFLAGHERYVANGAKVGFHASSFLGVSGAKFPFLNGETRSAMAAAGVDERFINRALAEPSSTMWFPSIDEMIKAGVVTSATFGERFGMSRLFAKDIGKYDLTRIYPSMASLREVAPDTYAELDAAWRQSIAAGDPEGAVGDRVRAVLAPKLKASLPRASDEALLQAVDFWISLLEQYKDSQPATVIKVMIAVETNPAGLHSNPMRLLPDYPIQKDMTVTVAIITSAIATGGKPINETQAKQDIDTVIEDLKKKAPEALAGLADIDSPSIKDPGATANAIWRFYVTIRDEIPRSRQGNLLRYLLKQ